MHDTVGVDDQSAVTIGIEAQVNARFFFRILAGVMIKTGSGVRSLQTSGMQSLEIITGMQSQETMPSDHTPDVDYVGYVRKLEKMLIVALAHLGVAAGQRSGLTGVWVQADVYSRCPRCRPEDRNKPAKLAAIGVKVDAHGISHHGFALNVNPDMSYWDGIVACGLAEYPLVSLADLLNEPPAMNKVKEEIILAFEQVFGLSVVPAGS